MDRKLLKRLFYDKFTFQDILEYSDLERYEPLALYKDILLDVTMRDEEFYQKVKCDYLENILFLKLKNE